MFPDLNSFFLFWNLVGSYSELACDQTRSLRFAMCSQSSWVVYCSNLDSVLQLLFTKLTYFFCSIFVGFIDSLPSFQLTKQFFRFHFVVLFNTSVPTENIRFGCALWSSSSVISIPHDKCTGRQIILKRNISTWTEAFLLVSAGRTFLSSFPRRVCLWLSFPLPTSLC